MDYYLNRNEWFCFYEFFSEINFPKYILFDFTRQQFGSEQTDVFFFTFQTFINTSENLLEKSFVVLLQKLALDRLLSLLLWKKDVKFSKEMFDWSWTGWPRAI